MKKASQKQTDRITHFEELYDEVSQAAANLEDALAAYAEARPKIEELTKYYDGKDWRKDYEADEAGLIPQGLKRGVLSQDGLYDLLGDVRELDILLGIKPQD